MASSGMVDARIDKQSTDATPFREDISFTTSELEGQRFTGSRPDPAYFSIAEPLPQVAMRIRIIDGEARIILPLPLPRRIAAFRDTESLSKTD